MKMKWELPMMIQALPLIRPILYPCPFRRKLDDGATVLISDMLSTASQWWNSQWKLWNLACFCSLTVLMARKRSSCRKQFIESAMWPKNHPGFCCVASDPWQFRLWGQKYWHQIVAETFCCWYFFMITLNLYAFCRLVLPRGTTLFILSNLNSAGAMNSVRWPNSGHPRPQAPQIN